MLFQLFWLVSEHWTVVTPRTTMVLNWENFRSFSSLQLPQHLTMMLKRGYFNCCHWLHRWILGTSTGRYGMEKLEMIASSSFFFYSKIGYTCNLFLKFFLVETNSLQINQTKRPRMYWNLVVNANLRIIWHVISSILELSPHFMPN